MLPIVKDPEHPVEATADYLIHEMDLNNLALTMDKWASQSTIGDFSMVEMNIALRTIELWEAGKIDMVLCAYSSTMPLLDEKGVPKLLPISGKKSAGVPDQRTSCTD